MFWFRLDFFCAIFALFCSNVFCSTQNENGKNYEIFTIVLVIFYYFLGQYATYLNLVHNGNKSYYIQSSFKANFLESFQFCKSNKMELLHIESKDENDFLSEQISKIGGHLEDDFYWTSGTRMAGNIAWMWLSNGEQFSYTNWRPNQPSDFNQICVAINAANNGKEKWNYKWSDIECERKHYFVCKITWTKKCSKPLYYKDYVSPVTIRR
ncbi:unnamed protein product [Phyllotreta striolata]|uniref:C-type lectin domain-containing protein n=1 Tax=Phyllotreta striolata TaxID=444603 RepID=A0A9N9XQW4_PHYSR|nr:unnamed protein product [Phyllotreta striolata]